MVIRRMLDSDIEDTAKLLDDYRVFYQQESDFDRAYKFLEDRVKHKDSVVFVAEKDKKLVGFVQLYPIFTTVGLNRSFLLNDIYVSKDYRKMGIASSLIEKTFEYGKEERASFVLLETAITNKEAQRVYERVGMKIQDDVNYYIKRLV